MNILAYKSFESLAEVAKGPANKVFIPSNAIETLGTRAIGEIFKENRRRDYLQIIQKRTIRVKREMGCRFSYYRKFRV